MKTRGITPRENSLLGKLNKREKKMDENRQHEMNSEPLREDPGPEEVETMEEPPKRVRRPRKNRKGLYLFAIAAVIVGYFAIAPRIAHANRLKEDMELIKSEPPLVSTIKVEPKAGASELTLPSNIQAIDETVIDAQTTGYLSQRFVDIGDHVKKGQVLATIQSPEVDQQLQASQAEKSKSVAGLGQSTADAAKLSADITGSRADLVRSQANLMQAKANLAHLQAKELQAESAVSVARSNENSLTKKLASVKADLDRANAGLTIANKTLVRWKQLEAGDAVSGQDVDEKQADYDAAQAQVEAERANVSSAEADVEGSQGAVRSAQAEESAAKADVESGRQSVAAAVAAVDASRANVQAAISAYQASQSQIKASSATVASDSANVRRVAALQGFEKIVAPFSGVITARNVDIGDLVRQTSSGSGASDPSSTVTKNGLFGLARTDELRVQVDVPESYVPAIHNGQGASVQVSEYPGKSFSGKVFDMAGALDAASRTLLVEVRVPNTENKLKPGMYAEVTFSNLQSSTVLRIPGSALIFDSAGTRVALVRPDGTIHFQTIKPGRDLGTDMEVSEGLSGGERVVTNPDYSLTEGEKVRVAESQ
jgi:RND family efflux transporter MFP subunit